MLPGTMQRRLSTIPDTQSGDRANRVQNVLSSHDAQRRS
jgi:hypothetical protein